MENQLIDDPRVYTTDPDRPSKGRTFVWDRTKWYEREIGKNGAVAFSPVADSYSELFRWLSQTGPVELTELENEFSLMVAEEFLDQDMLYPEAPELSDQYT